MVRDRRTPAQQPILRITPQGIATTAQILILAALLVQGIRIGVRTYDAIISLTQKVDEMATRLTVQETARTAADAKIAEVDKHESASWYEVQGLDRRVAGLEERAREAPQRPFTPIRIGPMGVSSP